MVNANNVVFPVTIDTFVSLQRAKMDRDFTETELEFFADIVDMANESYHAACRGDADTVQVLLDAISAADTGDSFSHHVARGYAADGSS